MSPGVASAAGSCVLLISAKELIKSARAIIVNCYRPHTLGGRRGRQAYEKEH